MTEDKPRYEPSYSSHQYHTDEFLGYVGLFDVWLDTRHKAEPVVAVVGPDSVKTHPNGPHNFDAFNVIGDRLVNQDKSDVHIDLHDMCLIYDLCKERGVITG